MQGRRAPAGHNILFWCGQNHHRSRDENCPGEEGTRLGRRTSRLLRTAGAPQLPDPLRGCGRGGRPRAERSRSRPGREEKQRVDQRRLRAVLSALRHPLRAQLRRRSIPAGLRPLPRAARPERALGRVVFRSFAWRRAPRGALKAPLCAAAAAVPRSAPAPVNRGALSGNGSGAPQRHRADGGRSAAELRGRTQSGEGGRGSAPPSGAALRGHVTRELRALLAGGRRAAAALAVGGEGRPRAAPHVEAAARNARRRRGSRLWGGRPPAVRGRPAAVPGRAATRRPCGAEPRDRRMALTDTRVFVCHPASSALPAGLGSL